MWCIDYYNVYSNMELWISNYMIKMKWLLSTMGHNLVKINQMIGPYTLCAYFSKCIHYINNLGGYPI